ncbi:MAG: alpha-galactosidase, partial [Clostridia bacterium]|nr:alpha-galactosidase [Clostridia bacterium]
MPITYHEKEQIFHLQTKNTSYIFGLFNGRNPTHLYYGKRMENIKSIGYFISQESARCSTYAIHPAELEKDLFLSAEIIPMEYPFYGNPDLKVPAFSAEYEDGSRITEAVYKSHKIYDGKPRLSGLPATYVENDSEAQTLELTLHDSVTGLDIVLLYTAYTELDAICRSVRVENNGTENIKLTSVLSASVDFLDKDFDFISLGGTWTRENQISRQPLFFGTQSVESRRGSSGHIHSPFFALARPEATERSGEVYGFSLVYSGNFICGTEVTEFDHSRAYIGINPFDFAWRLNPGEIFTAPEAVLVYSDEGIGGMSRTYHKLYRTRLARGNFRDKNRPPLANNWEGTDFRFDEEKILAIAQKAKEAHAELMVLDDGWFGERNSDTTSLGDWYPNLKKLPNGIGGLAKKINDMGLLFGLWFEPEMISPVSELNEKHPDWCIHVANRPKSLGRNQMILDLSRDEVCDFVIDFLSDFLGNNPISYIKWDYNRYFSEIGSAALPPEQQ